MLSDTKLCLSCKEVKPVEDFNRWKLSKDGRQVWCRACQKRERTANRLVYRQRQRQYYELNIQHFRAASRKWATANPEKRKAIYTAYRQRNLEQVRVRSVESWRRNKDKPANRETKRQVDRRRRAAQKNAPINDLTKAQWLEVVAQYQSCCAYCKQPQELLTMDHVIPLSAGGSHTKANVVPACYSCNSRKQKRPLAVFLAELAAAQ